MSYPHVAEAALLAGPKSLHRFAPVMMFVYLLIVLACKLTSTESSLPTFFSYF